MRRPVRRGPVVVKVGSSSLLDESGSIDDGAISRIVDEIAVAKSDGLAPVLVSSGAVAAGMPVLGMQRRPRRLADLQVAAAVGQGRLMHRYGEAFGERGIVAGQVLLTKDVLAHRPQYLNARSTLTRMLDAGVVPVVNENDAVAFEELRWGDNDRLAALVSHLVSASVLIILTDAGGLFSEDPRTHDTSELLHAVVHSDRLLDDLTQGASGPFGSGGIGSKILAARMAAWSGIPTVIAAPETGVVRRVVTGEDTGTWVEPQPRSLPARKLWLAFGQPSEGRVTVDDGAAAVLLHRGASLLSVGVVEVDGSFEAGAAVEVVDASGRMLGKGLVRMSAADLTRTRGQASGPEGGGEVIHRDDLVVLAP